MGEILCYLCIINNFLVLSSVSSLSYINTRQLLNKPLPDFTSQTTPVQITLFLCTINMINYAFMYY